MGLEQCGIELRRLAPDPAMRTMDVYTSFRAGVCIKLAA